MSQIRIQQILNFASNVIGTTLTGYTSGAGTVSSSDTILQGFQKINGNQALYALLGGATFTGAVVLAADPVTATATATATQIGATTSGYTYDFIVDNSASTSAGIITITLGTGFTAMTAITGENTLTNRLVS